MKVAMFLDSSFPPDSRVENEASFLVKNGIEVHLFSIEYHKNQAGYEQIKGIHVHRQFYGNFTYRLSALAYDVPLYHWIIAKSIRRFIDQIKPDVIHIHDMLMARAVMDQNKPKRPVILDLHENRPEIMREYPHLKKSPGKYLINIENWVRWQNRLAIRADRVIVVTESAKKELLKYITKPEDHILVLPNTIEEDIFMKYPIDQSIVQRFKGSFNLLYVGDTGLRRGTDTAINAVSHLKDHIPNVRLILVGKSTEDETLKKMVSTLSLTNYVVFEGWQDVSLFPSYIETAAVCLCPLKHNLHHHTTFANKLFQYMAIGKPILVSDCRAQAELVIQEHCGLVHKADDIDDFCEKIIQLYDDAQLRTKFSENAKRAVKTKWNWNTTAKGLLKLYKTISKD